MARRQSPPGLPSAARLADRPNSATRAAGPDRAVLPQTEAQAAPGAQYVPLAQEHRGFARQQPLPVAPRKRPVAVATAGTAGADLRGAGAALPGRHGPRPALHRDDR